MSDFNFTRYGSVTLITPSTPTALQAADDYFDPDYLHIDGCIVCEQRLALEAAANLCRDGWTCSLDGFELILRDPEPPHSGPDDEASPSEIRRD